MYKQCKTKQSIERQHKIGEMLMKLMEKQPYAKISVSELCRECYISRNVFYRYFDNIEDVFVFAVDELVLDLVRYTSEFPKGKAWSFEEETERFLNTGTSGVDF